MVRFLDIAEAEPSISSVYLTPTERVAVQRAPKASPGRALSGTNITVRAKPVRRAPGGPADHMWVEFDDGRRQFIARGGPDAHDAEMAASAAFDDLDVMGQVDPAVDSPDYGQGTRVVARSYLPGVTAEQATGEARRHAAGVNRRGNKYGWDYNSNSFAADVFEDLTGRRVGDARTPGAQNRLRETGPRRPLEERARELPYVIMPWTY